MRQIAVAITTCATLAVVLFGAPPPTVQAVVVLLAVAVGLPHGATDHLGLEASSKPWFDGLYLLGVAAFGALWWAFPPVALLLFVLASAWHFGEADLRDRRCAPGWHAALWGSRGLLVLGVLGVAHGETVAGWLGPLGGPAAVAPRVAWFFATAALTVHVLAALQGTEGDTADGVLMESAVLAAWVWVAPPLLAFALYFVLWHSLPQLTHQVRSGRAGTLGDLLREAAPHTVGAALLMGIGWAWLSRTSTLPGPSILLAMLGCLSMPHVAIEAWRRWPRPMALRSEHARPGAPERA